MQYEAANRADRVPCDEGGLEACPYTKRECGSPGDISENGCGLSAENASVVAFYPKWKTLGDAAFNLLELDFKDEVEADNFANKLMVIEGAAPLLEQALNSNREAEKSKEAIDKNNSQRRNAPKKV